MTECGYRALWGALLVKDEVFDFKHFGKKRIVPDNIRISSNVDQSTERFF